VAPPDAALAGMLQAHADRMRAARDPGRFVPSAAAR